MLQRGAAYALHARALCASVMPALRGVMLCYARRARGYVVMLLCVYAPQQQQRGGARRSSAKARRYGAYTRVRAAYGEAAQAPAARAAARSIYMRGSAFVAICAHKAARYYIYGVRGGAARAAAAARCAGI